MFLMNFWLIVGVCNSWIGLDVDIIYEFSIEFLLLFVVVIVKFDLFLGLFLVDSMFLCVFIILIIVIV